MAEAAAYGIDDVLSIVTDVFALDGEVHKNRFRMLCPNPDHDDTNPSCSVDLVTGLWNCWSCPAGGDLVDLGHYALGQKRKVVRKLLQPNEPDAMRYALQRRLQGRRAALRPARATRHRTELLIPPEGSYDDAPLTYLLRRGFNRKVLKKWGIRFAPLVTLFRQDSKPFEVTNAIAIPILSETEEMLAWCYRATPDSPRWFQEVRYIYTPGVQDTLNQHWFGEHMTVDGSVDNITLVEGALDAIWCHQWGIPAWAILGSQVKQTAKIRKLMRFRHVTLLTDRDPTGVTTAFGIGQALQARGIGVSVCRYASWMTNRQGKPAKDAQDLSGVDLELVHARAIPFLTWKQEGRRSA